jgi:hypothetical protein
MRVIVPIVTAMLFCQHAAARRGGSMEQLLTKAKDPLVRESAAQVLGLRGSPTSVPLLLGCLQKDDNLWVRARCGEALGQAGATTAIRQLRSALDREKDQRVRRTIAIALARLGQRTGVEELMWQLKSGTNHTKAEVMHFLVGITGQPLGQNVKAWWAYLARTGNRFLSLRAGGSPGLAAIEGRNPVVFSRSVRPWQQLPAVVLRFPTDRAITPDALRAHERRNGAIPDGCLLLLRGVAPAKKPAKAKNPPKAKKPALPGPGLTVEAARTLLKRAPKLLGVGIDARSIDPPTAKQRSAARDLLVSSGRLVLVGLDGLDRIAAHGTRLLLVDLGAGPEGGRRVRALAVLP